MQLNHLDLQVVDVQRAVLFFERHFGFALRSSRQSPALAILEGDGGFSLVLQRRKNPDDHYPEGFHFGFMVPDVETVERFHQAATADGLNVSEVIRNNRGTMVYCRSPEGFLVEVNCRPPITVLSTPGDET